jgi:hypothetical protein
VIPEDDQRTIRITGGNTPERRIGAYFSG